MSFHPDNLLSLKGKVFIVTGGNSGIGFHTVAHLAARGAHVYLGARSFERGNAAIADIKEMHPSAHIDLLQMDLKDLNSVVGAAQRFLALETALHGLVNNAGIMATPFEITRDGYEAQWQTNYLAHWVLTEHLLPILLQTSQGLPAGSVRIVNLSSSGHLGAPKCGINLKDLSLTKGNTWERYGQSKLANILHTKTLHKKYGPGSISASNGDGEIWTSAIHPGLVETNIDASAGDYDPSLYSVMRMVGLVWPADEGSWTSLYCAASRDMTVDQVGTYFELYRRLGEPISESPAAKNGKLAVSLEKWTKEEMNREGWVW